MATKRQKVEVTSDRTIEGESNATHDKRNCSIRLVGGKSCGKLRKINEVVSGKLGIRQLSLEAQFGRSCLRKVRGKYGSHRTTYMQCRTAKAAHRQLHALPHLLSLSCPSTLVSSHSIPIGHTFKSHTKQKAEKKHTASSLRSRELGPVATSCHAAKATGPRRHCREQKKTSRDNREAECKPWHKYAPLAFIHHSDISRLSPSTTHKGKQKKQSCRGLRGMAGGFHLESRRPRCTTGKNGSSIAQKKI